MLLGDVPIFDDLKSIGHLLLGAITPLLDGLGYIIFLIFLVYQIHEKEDVYHKLGDFTEYLIGFIISLLFFV